MYLVKHNKLNNVIIKATSSEKYFLTMQVRGRTSLFTVSCCLGEVWLRNRDPYSNGMRARVCDCVKQSVRSTTFGKNDVSVLNSRTVRS